MDFELDIGAPERGDLVADYIALREEKKDLDDRLAPVKARIAEIEAALADEFLRLGKTKETRNGTTVYVARHMSVKVLDPAALREGMHALGHDAMLSVHTGRLKSYLREAMHNENIDEWVCDPSRIPQEIRDSVTVSEYHKVQARSS